MEEDGVEVKRCWQDGRGKAEVEQEREEGSRTAGRERSEMNGGGLGKRDERRSVPNSKHEKVEKRMSGGQRMSVLEERGGGCEEEVSKVGEDWHGGRLGARAEFGRSRDAKRVCREEAKRGESGKMEEARQSAVGIGRGLWRNGLSRRYRIDAGGRERRGEGDRM